jgi:hypothetical protein
MILVGNKISEWVRNAQVADSRNKNASNYARPVLHRPANLHQLYRRKDSIACLIGTPWTWRS